MYARKQDSGLTDPALRAFADQLARLPKAEADRVFANFLRALGLVQCADAWAADQSVPLDLFYEEVDAVKAQTHADEVAAELLADVDL